MNIQKEETSCQGRSAAELFAIGAMNEFLQQRFYRATRKIDKKNPLKIILKNKIYFFLLLLF